MNQEIYSSSALGPIPLTANGKKLMAQLRMATRAAVRDPESSAAWTNVSAARGEIAKYMSSLEKTVGSMINAPPTEMSTPLGLLPVNSTGMRRVVDELVEERSRLEEESEDYRKLQHKLETANKQLADLSAHSKMQADTALVEKALIQHWMNNTTQSEMKRVELVEQVEKLQRELKMARDVIETYRNSGANPVRNFPVRLAHYTTGQLFAELAKRDFAAPKGEERNSEVAHMATKQLFDELSKRFT